MINIQEGGAPAEANVWNRPAGLTWHGYLVQLLHIASSIEHALLVRQWSPDVVYFSHGEGLSAERREQLVARAIGVVDVYSINSSVAVVKLAGKLPLEPGYVLHGN